MQKNRTTSWAKGFLFTFFILLVLTIVYFIFKFNLNNCASSEEETIVCPIFIVFGPIVFGGLIVVELLLSAIISYVYIRLKNKNKPQ